MKNGWFAWGKSLCLQGKLIKYQNFWVFKKFKFKEEKDP